MRTSPRSGVTLTARRLSAAGAVIGILGLAGWLLDTPAVSIPLPIAVLVAVALPLAVALLLVTARSMARDDSAREAAEAAARRSEARLEGMITLAADAIVTVDESGAIVMYNQGATRIFGWSQDEALGRPLDLLLPDRFRAAHRARVQAFGSEAADARMMNERRRVVGRRKNGDEFPAEAAISKLREDGRWLYTVILRDTAHTVQLEDQLRQSVARFRFLSDVSDYLSASLEDRMSLTRVAELVVEAVAVCCTIEVDTPPHRLVLRCTRGGAAKTVSHNAPVLTVREPTLYHDVNGATWRSIAAGDVLDYPGDADAGSLIAVAIVHGGQRLGALAMLSGRERRYDDADLQMAIELARRIGLALDNERLYHEAQAATRARDDMLSIVAHDLRAPLSAVQFGADALARQVPLERRVATQKAVHAIQRAIHHATRLVDDLLDAGRIDAGQLQVVAKDTSPARILAEVADAFAARAAAAGVALEVESGTCPPTLRADDDRLHQALANLVDNAIKFTPAGGRVCVTARQQDGEVRIVVSDTGPGIPAEHLPRLFDRFWQARANRRGAGLGLAIVKGIVEAHGGRVWAESVPGRGTTFVIALPAVAPCAA